MANPLHASLNNSSSDEVILVTGAGGSIGSSLAKHLLSSATDRADSDQRVRAQYCCAPSRQNASRTVIFLDHSEQNLYEIHSELSSLDAISAKIIPLLGNVNDVSLLEALFENYRPTQIFHTAAFKHVPLMEENPIAVIRNNILGTRTLATVAMQHKARQLVMVSTDKAADPRSIMGATKRVAELILSCLDSPDTRMRSVRLCNVLRSTGSVVPLFERQIRTGGPVTITHADASRYFISLQEATSLIFLTAALDDHGTLFVPKPAFPVRILDLARKMIAEAQESSSKEIKMVVTGLRPGEKLTESLFSSSETVEPTTEPRLHRINGPLPAVETLRSAVGVISENVLSRNLPAMIDVIRSLVSEYQPSETLRALTPSQHSATAKA